MTIQDIRKLLEPIEGSDFTSTSDYQRLRTEEWRCLSLASCFFLFGFTALTSRDILSVWGTCAILAFFLGGATIFAIRGCKCRKACGMFERYCPESLQELEEKIKPSGPPESQAA